MTRSEGPSEVTQDARWERPKGRDRAVCHGKKAASVTASVGTTSARSSQSLRCSQLVSAINRQPWQAAPRRCIGVVLGARRSARAAPRRGNRSRAKSSSAACVRANAALDQSHRGQSKLVPQLGDEPRFLYLLAAAAEAPALQ